MTFSNAALDQGRSMGYRLGLTTVSRQITRNDIQAIITAVLATEYEPREMYVESGISESWVELAEKDVLRHTRDTLTRRLAVEVVEHGCVMLELPRETIRQADFGLRMIRLTVSVRRVSQ